MNRRTFDSLMAVAGVVLAVVLAVAGGLLIWAHSYIGGQVHDELAAQKIYFPAANSAAVAAPQFAPMRQYGGQQLTTGAQARVYANYFINNHLAEMANGQTYSQLSTQSLAQPDNTKLAALVQKVFQGETLRGLLLNAYAFGTMATIAGWAALAAFIGAGLMMVLSGLGFYHSRKVRSDAVLNFGEMETKLVEANTNA